MALTFHVFQLVTEIQTVENFKSCMNWISRGMQERRLSIYPLRSCGSLKTEHHLSLFLTLTTSSHKPLIYFIEKT